LSWSQAPYLFPNSGSSDHWNTGQGWPELRAAGPDDFQQPVWFEHGQLSGTAPRLTIATSQSLITGSGFAWKYHHLGTEEPFLMKKKFEFPEMTRIPSMLLL